MKHELKSHPKYFQASWRGSKPFEIRENDRDFKVMDDVVLKEWDPDTKEYTGREIKGWINYVTDFNQVGKFVVFSFEIIGRTE